MAGVGNVFYMRTVGIIAAVFPHATDAGAVGEHFSDGFNFDITQAVSVKEGGPALSLLSGRGGKLSEAVKGICQYFRFGGIQIEMATGVAERHVVLRCTGEKTTEVLPEALSAGWGIAGDEVSEKRGI